MLEQAYSFPKTVKELRQMHKTCLFINTNKGTAQRSNPNFHICSCFTVKSMALIMNHIIVCKWRR